MDFLLPNLAFIEGLGGPEMMLILVIVLVLFGGEKLPDFARGLGKSIREFKKAASGVEEEFKRALEEDERKKTPPPPTTFPAYPPVAAQIEAPAAQPALEAPPADSTTIPTEDVAGAPAVGTAPTATTITPATEPPPNVAVSTETPAAPTILPPAKTEPRPPAHTDNLP